MKFKLYDLIKNLLTDYPELRDSDKKLIWEVWSKLDFINDDDGSYDGELITYQNFVDAPSTETIRRCRQKIQELNPELRGSQKIRKAREEKAKEKGTFIYREITEEQIKLV